MRILMLSRDQAAFKEDSAVVKRWKNELMNMAYSNSICAIVMAREGRPYTLQINPTKQIEINAATSPYLIVRFFRALFLAVQNAKDCDYVTSQDPLELGLIAWVASVMSGKPFEIQDHGGYFDGEDPYEPFWFIRKHIPWFLAKRAEKIRTVSYGSCEELTKAGYGEKVYFKPISPDLRYLGAKRDPKNIQRGLIVTVGRYARVKRYELLLKIFAIIKKSMPDAKLWIIANATTDQEHKYKRELESLAVDLGISDSVSFLSDVHPMEALKVARMFVLTSAHEGYSLAAREATLMQVPVVMAPTGIARNPLLSAKRIYATDKLRSNNPQDWADEILSYMTIV